MNLSSSKFSIQWPKFVSKATFSREEDFINFVNHNHLGGIAYTTLDLNEFQISWKKNWVNNLIKENLIQNLAPLFLKYKINPILLKGYALNQILYPSEGLRFMSDIDILINTDEEHSVLKIMKESNFIPLKEIKWYGDDFKMTFTKIINGSEVVIEFHTRLFFHIKKQTCWKKTNLNISPYSILSTEDQFVHLCGHLAFQHSYLKFYWIIDLLYFYQKNINTIDWDLVYKRSRELQLLVSVKQVIWILKKYFNQPVSQKVTKLFKTNSLYVWKLFLTRNILIKDDQRGFNYFMIKHLTKDSLFESIKYDILWMYHKIGTSRKQEKKESPEKDISQ